MDIDLKQLKELMRSLKQFDISELELEKNGERIKLCRSVESGAREYTVAPSLVGSIPPPSAPSASIAPPPSASVDDASCFFITSPFVGTFYASATPGADPFVKVGSEIKPGQTLCIVEAMKLMNEIEAEASGTVVEVLRENGKPVEYGDRLFKVKKELNGVFKKVLIANRGEIALRIIRGCRELGIPTVAVHSQADADAVHVRFADEAVCIGPPSAKESYLNVPRIIAAAEISGADAVHPGYGFLSENAEFADICRQCGLTFIGPTPENMQAWGDKVTARANAKRLGLPLLPGTGVLRDVDDAVEQAKRVGFPVMLKASGGGGGRGMQILRSEQDVRTGFPRAQQEAIAGFKNGDLYLERYVEEPRHIEFQVLCDGKGNVSVLGERECSIQRRHQKLLEEAPSLMVSDELRRDMAATITRAMRESSYQSLGTLEFIMDEGGELYFMEMNTRIQVEHPVTEIVTGVDLVAEQLRVAAGQPISYPYEQIFTPRGHAIECRINAEDPDSFVPWPGLITEYHPPGGTGVRVDDGVYGGYRVPSLYDSLIAKIITYGRNRPEAIARMRRALSETIISGIRTTIPLHQRILASEDYIAGRISTRFLERLPAK